MADNGKRALDGEQRAEMRAAYEAGASINELSKRYGVRRHTIAGWRDKEAWAVQPTVQVDAPTVQRRAQAQVIDIATRKAVERATENGTLEDAVVAIARDLTMQGTIAVKVLEAVDTTLDKFIAGKIRPSDKQNLGDVLCSVVSAAKAGFALSREMHGKRPGDPSIAAAADSKIDQIEFYVPSLEEIAESASA